MRKILYFSRFALEHHVPLATIVTTDAANEVRSNGIRSAMLVPASVVKGIFPATKIRLHNTAVAEMMTKLHGTCVCVFVFEFVLKRCCSSDDMMTIKTYVVHLALIIKKKTFD